MLLASCGLQLLECGGAAVGIEAPKYKPFYKIPLFVTKITGVSPEERICL